VSWAQWTVSKITGGLNYFRPQKRATILSMNTAWRFRFIRDDGTSRFVRRAAPFIGSIQAALEFAERCRGHFGDVSRRVEAWSIDPITPEASDRKVFFIQRHENGKDWLLLKSPGTHPL
jgi:hypothetical protein